MDNRIVEIRRIGSTGDGLSCRRVEFQQQPASGTCIVCFLPWLFSYARSLESGLIPPGCLLAYEMPHAIVSPLPAKSVDALQVVVRDFLAILHQRQLDAADVTLVGLSIGNFVATYIANQIGARLFSVASGDRGEVLVWSSPLADGIRKQAETSGLRYADFETTLNTFNPINNLDNIGDGSVFIAGRFDKVIPYRCARNVALTARAQNSTTRRIVLPLGHTSTLLAGARYLRFLTKPRAKTRASTAKEANAGSGPAAC